MAAPIVLGITIRADGSAQVAGEINRIREAVTGAGSAAQGSNRQFAEMGASMAAMAKGLVGLYAIKQLATDILNTNREMEGLRAQLKALTGTAAEAQRTFEFITKFAVNTPFEINGLTKSFVMLQNFGIKPTEQVMTALTNQAAKLGGSQETLSGITLALGQAYSKGKLQAEEMNQLIERGVPIYKLLAEVTGKNTGELQDMAKSGELTREVIDKVIVKMGELASGSNAAAMETLNGKISNLADAWHQFEDALMGDKSEGLIKSIVSSITEALSLLARNMSGALDMQIAHAEARVKTFNGLGAVGSFVSDLSGYDINVEKNKIDSLKHLKEKQDNAHKEIEINNDRAAAIAQTNEWLSELETTDSETVAKKLKAHEKDASKAVDTAVNEAKRKAEAIAKGVADELAALNDQHQKLILSERDYYAQSDALKEMSPAVKAFAMAQWDVNTALAAQKTSSDSANTELAALKDKYDQLTLSARDYYATTLTSADGTPFTPEQKAPIMAQFDKTAAFEASKKSTDEARSVLEGYNKELTATNSSLSELGATNTAVFQSSLGPMSAVVGILGEMAKGAKKSSDAFARLAIERKNIDSFQPSLDKDKYLGDLKLKHDKETENEKDTQALQRQTRDQYIEGTGAMASAMASMFLSNKDAQLANQAIALVTLGIQAVLAIVTQGEGDPYTAFARIAAMAAIVAGLVSSVGGKSPTPGGGSIASPTTGTVLGDTTKGSESVKNVYDLLQTIHAEEYAELRGINSGVAALRTGITETITRVFQAGGLKSIELQPIAQGKGPFGGLGNLDLVQMVIRGLFMAKTTQTVTATGIQTQAYQIGQDFKAQQYDVIQTIKKTWLSSKTTFTTQYHDLDSATTKAIGNVFDSIGSTMLSVSDTLGKQVGKDVSAGVLAYIVPQLNIDLKGLNSEDAAKKLNGVISTALDTMSAAVFGDIVGQYQKLGEGMLETAIRIVAEVAVVKDALATSGLSMATNAIAISDALIQAAGGITEFKTQFSAYFDKFYTDNQKQAAAYKSLSSSLLDVLTVLPQTREGYRKLIEALNVANPLDQARYTLLIKLSAAADSYYSTLEAQMTTAKDNLSAAYKSESDALTVTINKFDAFSVSLKSFRDSLLVGDLAASSPADKYRLTQAAFNTNTTAINAGPGATTASKEAFDTAMGTLQANSQSFLSASRDYSASALAYAADYGQVIAALNSGISSADTAKSTATLQLDQLKASVSGLITINESVLSVRDAILAIRNIQAGQDSATAAATLAVSKARVPQFAAGGEHSGGWRVVGENGPEIERTGPSRIFSNQQSKSLVNNDDLIAEINKLREEARANALAIAQASAETAKILKRWDGDGMPAARMLA